MEKVEEWLPKLIVWGLTAKENKKIFVGDRNILYLGQ